MVASEYFFLFRNLSLDCNSYLHVEYVTTVYGNTLDTHDIPTLFIDDQPIHSAKGKANIML